MRFPYQYTLGSTLRSLYEIGRKQSFARNLGLSSITKGEGSFDGLATDAATTPEWAIGDLDDGTFGIGAKINGQIVNIANWTKTRTDQLQSAVNTEKSRNDSQDTIIANHTGRLDSHASRIGAVENAVGDAASTGTVAQLAAQVGSQALEIISLKARVKHLEDFIKPDRMDP